VSQQEGEPFLSEMGVVRQDFGHAFLPHCHHRNAVGEAVAFVLVVLCRGKSLRERSGGIGVLRSPMDRKAAVFDGIDGEGP